MELQNGTIKVIIKPNAPKSEILQYIKTKKAYRIAIKAPPEKGKANKELIRFLNKETKKKATIISGMTSREKLIKISDK